MQYAPIMLTVFKRRDHAQKTIDALSKNDLAKHSELYIYSDGPKKPEDNKKISDVRAMLKKVKGFKKITIIEAPQNKGLAKSMIFGVTELVEKYGKVIVMEDDLITQRYFLNVMNLMLNYYESDKRVGAVTAFMQSTRQIKKPQNYKQDVFFNVRPTSTGWGTWKDRWENVDWEISDFNTLMSDRLLQKKFKRGGGDLVNMLKAKMNGKIDSWAIRWAYHFCKKDLVSVQTVESYVDNIGYDASGVHSKNENYYFIQESMATKSELKLIPYNGTPTWDVIKEYRKPYTFGWAYFKKKVYSKLGILIK